VADVKVVQEASLPFQDLHGAPMVCPWRKREKMRAMNIHGTEDPEEAGGALLRGSTAGILPVKTWRVARNRWPPKYPHLPEVPKSKEFIKYTMLYITLSLTINII